VYLISITYQLFFILKKCNIIFVAFNLSIFLNSKIFNLIRFILNDKEVATTLANTTLLLDFIRYNKNLTGTKIGCREGDCGACTVLVGEIINEELHYYSATSCLTPIGNINGKHIVTIEGINFDDSLNPIQQAMSNESATQCGFCTPGFIVSLAGFCLNKNTPTYENAIASIDGNICRCTGYKPIERAAKNVCNLLQDKPQKNIASYLVNKNILPKYFENIEQKLQALNLESIEKITTVAHIYIGGGTDLYVQKHDEMLDATAQFMAIDTNLQYIKNDNGICKIGASTTVTQMQESKLLQQHFPNLQQHIKLISSTPIRNIATIAGNLANASPIGDLTIFFLALNASIGLKNSKNEERTILLSNFYKGYKQLDKTIDEHITTIEFELPTFNTLFNFEKVSKRTYLDIASVNTAICLQHNNNIITSAIISCGGVNAIPMQLLKASQFLINKNINAENINACIKIALTEIAPISDARGTKEYKMLLLSQLIKAHFITMFDEVDAEELILL
jgi:xanthine dehydrogenase small subunit